MKPAPIGPVNTPREYRSWAGMIDRCTNPRRCQWKDYGGRGILVCDSWRKFSNFYKEMGPRPDGMTLDRIDVNGNYEASNCRWASKIEQARNARNNRPVTINGETKLISHWAQELGIAQSALRFRLRNKWPVEELLSAPNRFRRVTKYLRESA